MIYTKRELISILNMLNSLSFAGEESARLVLGMIDKTKKMIAAAKDEDIPKNKKLGRGVAEEKK